MPLNVVSNYAANVAHRNLAMTDAQASQSLARLSIGKRVVSARDDAASMAIGSRMNAEVQGLKQAVVNAGQANSMLQIADGAMGMVSDILTRMKVLSIQASSENLGTTEREFLNVEFQALMAEVDRIADDTDFNGTQLLDGEIAVTQSANLGTANGVAGLSAQGVDTNGTFTIAYDGTDTFTVDDGTNSYTGTIAAALLDTNGALTRSTTIQLTSTTGAGSLSVALNTAFDSATAVAAEAFTVAGTTELSLGFKLGTGTETYDSLSFTLNAVSITGLGFTGTETIDTAANAESALEAVNTAIDNLNAFRADVGAAQNRLQFASENLSISIENAEAARSTLQDLDIAAEMTNFTSKQVLMQSGVAMLAQANQLPQNLLRLLQ
ncbi:MAG: flagellin domain protein [Geminicoccaceae bacterium]|nr:flagellin domain protein [Geminicoccaceae bacterium]